MARKQICRQKEMRAKRFFFFKKKTGRSKKFLTQIKNLNEEKRINERTKERKDPVSKSRLYIYKYS